MKKALVLLFLTQQLFSQYTIKSPYLQNPALTFGYVDSCAKFWMKAYDPVNGGFYVNINRQGNHFTPDMKNSLNQSRDAYGLTRAFQMTGDTTYLRYARYALNFMYKNAWDVTNRGWYTENNTTGGLPSPNAVKTAYYQHYAALGITASFEATRDTNDWNWLMKSYDYNEEKLWDKDISNFGYYDYVAANGTNPTDKSFNATVDAVTTHVLHLYLMTGDPKYKLRLLELADNMIYHLAASAASQQIGFAERYTSTWQIKSGTDDEKRTIMGHVLKTGWCLARIYQLEKNPQYLATAENLVKIVLDKGYDHQNGGPYKDYYRATGAMMMYGISDTAKAWWQMEQAITAGFMLYQLTGKEQYLKMADETLDFFMKYFVDHLYGDVFESTNKYGGMITQWGTNKGGTGKAAYHSIETGYYTYLYGKLLVKKEPATLYYSFSPLQQLRQLRMRPIGVPDGYLKIASVKRNGTLYTNYDSTNLTLTLPANIDGIFSVTYAPTNITVSVADNENTPNDFSLQQNYPNPFNPNTTITFAMKNTEHVNVTVYNALGQTVTTLFNGTANPNERYSLTFSGKNLSSGTYFYALRSATRNEVRKMSLMK